MKFNKTIGIIGGMGAAASADFYKKLVELAQQDYHAVNDDDFPAMFIYNLPIKDFDETGFVDPDSVKNQLITGVKKLQIAGSDFVVIICNTAHYFQDEMEQAINIPILSILKVTADEALRQGYKKIGLLNSQSTKQYRLYETAMANRRIATLSTTDSEQLGVNHVISNVISGTQGMAGKTVLQAIINRYVSEGAEAVVLGCTELPLAITQADSTIPVLSSTDLLAKATLQTAMMSVA